MTSHPLNRHWHIILLLLPTVPMLKKPISKYKIKDLFFFFSLKKND